MYDGQSDNASALRGSYNPFLISLINLINQAAVDLNPKLKEELNTTSKHRSINLLHFCQR